MIGESRMVAWDGVRSFGDTGVAAQQPQPSDRHQPLGRFGRCAVAVGELMHHGRDFTIGTGGRGRR